MAAALRAEGLGKRYRLVPRERYQALRDTLEGLVRAPLARFGRGTVAPPWMWALRDVTFAVAPGSVVGIVGRNGSGKTTLLRVLSRITRPTAGRAEVRGRVGSLLEVGTGFHPELSGRENVFLSGAILGMRRAEIQAKFELIVAFSGVEAYLDQPLKRYSSGMQLRLAFAVAAHLEPEILLVDEVLAVGDLEFQRKCLGRLEEVSRGGRTVLLVSHQMSQIRRLCKRTIWLDAGTIRTDGETADVVAAYERALLSDPEIRPGAAGAAVEFLGWELLDGDAPAGHVVRTHGPVAFAVRVLVRRAVARGEYGITLHDVERRPVWSTSVEGVRLDPGVHRVVHRLPHLPLRPGGYSWQAGLHDGHEWTVWWAIPDLLLETTFLTHQRHEEHMGVLNVAAAVDIVRWGDG